MNEGADMIKSSDLRLSRAGHRESTEPVSIGQPRSSLGAYGAVRGHLTRFDEDAWEWVYADTLEPIGAGNSRPCIRCGKPPTPEGHDTCIGALEGNVIAACCGHGIEPPYAMFADGSKIEGMLGISAHLLREALDTGAMV